MSTSFMSFAPPSTVTPGEYLVCSHEHYHKTPMNARWHRESEISVDDEDTRMTLDSDSESEFESDSDASSCASRSPSPCSSASSYRTAMSTPPPECDSDSRETSLAPSTARASASRHRKSYRRLVEAERKVTLRHRLVAQKRTRLEETACVPSSARSIVCQWGGCGERVADGRQLWSHIERVHKPLGGADDVKVATGRERMEEEVDAEASAQGAVHTHEHDPTTVLDDDCDELEDDDSDEDWAASSRSGAVRRSQWNCTDRYQVRIRCQWKRCTTTIQFAGLRRHIESKHSGLRNTSCPKGCGYVTNRPDMMPRHSVKCHYRGPRREAVVEE